MRGLVEPPREVYADLNNILDLPKGTVKKDDKYYVTKSKF